MWKTLFIPDDILKAVEELGFEEPTPIQQQVLPIALRDYVDILGSAPTVSVFGNFNLDCFGVVLWLRQALILNNDVWCFQTTNLDNVGNAVSLL